MGVLLIYSELIQKFLKIPESVLRWLNTLRISQNDLMCLDLIKKEEPRETGRLIVEKKH